MIDWFTTILFIGMYLIKCKQCECNIYTKDKRQKFCSQKCNAFYNNPLHPSPTEETKQKIRDGLIRYYDAHPEKRKIDSRGQEYVKFIGSFTKGKFKGAFIESILNVSKRTVSKILKRLNLGCCICKWKEGSCDIHHINGRKIENADKHENLTLLCPNHHRLFHEKKILKEDVISLDKYFPENWRDLYYG